MFCLLLWRVDLASLAAVFGRMDPALPLLASLSVIPILLLRTHRWLLMMQPHRKFIGFGEGLGAYGLAVLAGTFTPGQLGELGKAYLAQRKGVPLGIAVFASLADRVLDLLFLLGVGLVFAVLVWGPRRVAPLLAIFLLLAVVAWGFVRFLKRAEAGRGERWRERLLSLLDGFPRLGVRVQSLACGQTALAWMLNWLAIEVCARGLRLDLPFFYLCGVMALSALVAILPITILGMGTRDAVLVVMLGRIGYGEAQALSLSVMVLGLRLTYAGLSALIPMLPGCQPVSDGETGARSE